jgi:hypothetical protein
MVSQEQVPRPGDIDLSEFKQIGCEVIDAIADNNKSAEMEAIKCSSESYSLPTEVSAT